ncbi:hypothetical protein Rctr197k_053 [Virus Rctr197k]|nr:hypothetical protein Rctr197k_053 [Virus Rctr197k]
MRNLVLTLGCILTAVCLVGTVTCGDGVVQGSPAHGPRHGPSNGTHTTSGNTAVPLAEFYAPILIWTGQSNALGNGTTAQSTTQPYSNRRWNGSDLIALVEVTLESPVSGTSNQITYQDTGNDRLTAAYNWAIGATPYSGLAQGTSPYNNAQTEQNQLFADFITDQPALTACAGPLVVDHGETDANNGRTAVQYQADLTTWGNDWADDTVAAGHARCPGAPLVVYNQRSNWTTSNAGVSWFSTVAAGQFAAHWADPSHFVLTHAQYPFTWVDGLHLSTTGQRLSAAYFGKAQHFGWLAGRVWRPLEPATITCSGNTITMAVQGGHGLTDLLVDETTVVRKPYGGFSYAEATPQTEMPVVTGYSVSGRTVTVTLDRNCDTDGRLQYAHRAIPTVSASPATHAAVGGNIRNQDTTLAQFDGATPLPDWLVGFDFPFTSCPGCTPSALWTWANTDSFLADNSPATWMSSGHLPEIDGIGAFSFVYWIRGNGTFFSSGSGSTHINQWAGTTQRQFLEQGSGSNTIQIFWPSSLSDSGNSWLSASGAFNGCAAAWCMIAIVGDGSGGTPDAKLDVYRCDAGSCTEISTGGVFTGTWPATTLPAAGRADFAVGARSGGGGSTSIEYTMSHVQFWTTNITSGNVSSLYNSGTPIDPRTVGAGPCHYYPFQLNGKDIGSCAPIDARPYGTGAIWSSLNP